MANSYTPGPPLLFSLSRYTAEEGWRIVISGRYLDVCDYVAVNGIQVPASDITNLSHHRIAIVVPAGAKSGSITVRSSFGSDTSKFTLTITSPPVDQSPSPTSSSPSFNLDLAINSFGSFVPRPFRSFFGSVGNAWRAFETARSSTPFAAGGDWLNYSVQNSDFNKWNRSRERAHDYRERANAASTEAERERWERMAEKAQGVATQRGQAAAGSAVAGAAAGVGIGQTMGTSGILSGIGGAIGSIWGPIGQMAGAAIGTVVEKLIGLVVDSIKKAISNVREGGEMGSQIVESLTSGIKEHFHAIRDTGTGIANALIDGLTPMLGPSGGAIGRFGKQLTGFVGKALEGLFDGAGGALKMGGKAAGMLGVGAGAVGGWAVGGYLGMTIGAIGLPIGAALGAAIGSGIGLMIAKVVASLADMGGKVIGAFGKVFGEIGQLATGFLRTILDMMQAAKSAIMEYSRAVYDLSSHSGMNFTQSQNIINSRLAFGMGPEQTSGIYGQFNRMPIFANAMKAAFGVEGEAGSDEEFRSILDRGRRLPLMLRRIMFQNMPEGEDFWLKLVGMPQQKVESQLSFFKNMDLGGGAIKGAAEDLFLLQSRFDGFTQFIYRTLGSALLPVFTTAMESITNFLKANQGNIKDWVMSIGQFFYVQLPTYIGQGVEMVLTMVSKLINGVDLMMTALRQNIKPILDFFDGILNGIRSFVINIGSVVAATLAFGRGGPVAAVAAYTATQVWLNNAIPQSQLGQNSALINSANRGLAAAQSTYRQNFLNPANRMLNSGITWAQGQQAGQARRQQAFDDSQAQIARNTARIVDNTAAAPEETGRVVGGQLRDAMLEIIGVALRNARRDDYFTARRA